MSEMRHRDEFARGSSSSSPLHDVCAHTHIDTTLPTSPNHHSHHHSDTSTRNSTGNHHLFTAIDDHHHNTRTSVTLPHITTLSSPPLHTDDSLSSHLSPNMIHHVGASSDINLINTSLPTTSIDEIESQAQFEFDMNRHNSLVNSSQILLSVKNVRQINGDHSLSPIPISSNTNVQPTPRGQLLISSSPSSSSPHHDFSRSGAKNDFTYTTGVSTSSVSNTPPLKFGRRQKFGLRLKSRYSTSCEFKHIYAYSCIKQSL